MPKVYSMVVPVASFLLAAGAGAFSASLMMEHSGDYAFSRQQNEIDASMLPELVDVEMTTEGGNRGRSISVGKFEVTIAQYNACVDEGACKYRPRMSKYKTDNHPITEISWMDASVYVRWLSARTGAYYRLPLNSEWEVFADNLLGAEPKKLFDDPRMAWAADYASYGKRPSKSTREVIDYPPNDIGIHGVDGNVWEWTDTCWRNGETMSSPDDEGRDCGGIRILQGLHKTQQSEFIRSVKVGGCSIGFAPSNIGFRVVRENSKALHS